MFKREIKPLSEAMIESITKSINKLQYVDEAANRPADREEGDTKPQDISGSEVVKADGSATQAPKRKADKSGAEPMQKVAEEVEELDESKALLKDYQDMKAQGKKDHNILDALMSMPKYKKMSRDQMAKVIGDAKRKGIFKEDLDLNEAKLDASDFEAEDPPKGIDFDTKNLRKVNWKLYDDKTIREIIKRADNNADEPSIHGSGHNQSRGYYQQIIKAAKAELKKRGIKEDIEITELHMSLLEAHGIEKKVAEKVKKVFDAMSTEDKAAFMKAYLKNPKAATEYMFKDMKKMAKEEVELDEAMDPVDAKALKGKHSERKDKDIDNDGDVDSSDEYLHKRRKAISKALKKEEVDSSIEKKPELEEAKRKGAPKMQGDFLKKERERNRAHDAAMGRTATGRKKPQRAMTSTQRSLASMRNEEVELDEDVRKMSNSRLKFHMNNKNVPHGSFSWDEMKAERDRRLKTGDAEAYKKAKMSMSEEVEQIDEARWEYKGDKTYMVGGNLRYDDKLEYKLSKANADILNKYMKQAKSDAERSKVWSMFWDSKETGNYAKGPDMAIAYAKKAIKEEVELDEAKSVEQQISDLESMLNRMRGNTSSMKMKKYAIQKKIDNLKSSLDEAKSATGYTINHKTFSAAVQHAKAQVEKQGYTIDDDEWDHKVAMGPKKPGTGKTNRYTIDLMKGGKETRRKLQMQVYYDEGRYELNMYIS